MKVNLFYFTGTGNSLFIANSLSNYFKNSTTNPITVSLMQKKIISDSSITGVDFPVYCLDMPNIVKKFLSSIKMANDSYFFVIYNFGGSFGNVPYNCFINLKKNNIDLKNYFGIKIPENSNVYKSSDHDNAITLRTAKNEINKIATQVSKRLKRIPPKKKSRDMLNSYILKTGTITLGFKKIIVNEDRCTKCKKCTQICSVNNIYIDKKIKFKNKCEMCFACIHYCDNKCLRFKEMKKHNNYQYRNPYIKESLLLNKKERKYVK